MPAIVHHFCAKWRHSVPASPNRCRVHQWWGYQGLGVSPWPLPHSVTWTVWPEKDLSLWRQHISLLAGLTCILIHAQSLSFVPLFATPWIVARQAPLSMGFSRQEHWSGLPFHSPGDLPNPGIKPKSSASPALTDRFFTTESPGKPGRSHLHQNQDCVWNPIGCQGPERISRQPGGLSAGPTPSHVLLNSQGSCSLGRPGRVQTTWAVFW